MKADVSMTNTVKKGTLMEDISEHMGLVVRMLILDTKG